MIKDLKDKNFMTMNLSRFDAGEGDTETNEGNKEENGKEQETGNRTYNDNDVDRIVAKHKAKWEKEQKAAIENAVKDAQEEAKKLAKMNAEQKAKYEQEKQNREIEAIKAENERLKAEALKSELSKQAARQMKEDHEIIATQDMLDFVVGSDAETTSKNIDKLIGIILDDRKQQERQRAIGRTPQAFRNNGESISEIQKRINKYKK